MTAFVEKAAEIVALRFGHFDSILEAFIEGALTEAVAAERAACVEKLDALVEKRQKTFERFERVGAGAAEVNNAEGALDAADEAAAAIRARGNSIASDLSPPRTESE